MKKIFYTVLGSILIGTGCSQSEPASDQRIAGARRDYSEAELNEILAPGTPLAAVTNEFGPPVTTLTRDSNSVLMVYTFPFSEKRAPGSLSGFTVQLDGGAVSRWLPATRGSSGPQISTKAYSTKVSHEFLVYTATKEDAPLVEEFKTKGIVSAGHLRGAANLTLRGRAVTYEPEKPGEWPVSLLLDEKSAADIQSFTETNSGAQLLIVFETNIIAAPESAYINSKRVNFSLRNKEIVERLRKN